VLRAGELQQVAPPEVLYAEPDNTFVAAFTGSPSMNLVEGRLERSEGAAAAADGLTVVLGKQRLVLPPEVVASRPALTTYTGRNGVVGIRPEALSDASVDPRGDSPVGVLEGVIERREALGGEILAHVEIEAKPVMSDDVKQLAAQSDDAVV